MLNEEPRKVSKRALDKWKELGPLNLEKLIEDP